MKKTFKNVLAVAFLAVSLTANATIERDHRAIWMSPFLASNWPSGAITTGNAATQKKILDNRLDIFKSQNVNVLYYHARAMCDATYNSAYEPWSSNVSGKRGQAPGFDPFGYLVEAAHLRGIEVYAWLNPYRYASNGTGYGSNAASNDYEVLHPDWLMHKSDQTYLNPGIEEVKQRVVDVCADIMSKYDIDGIVFDDYFYPQGGTDSSLDATQYNAYKSGGGSLSLADWRRANINEMVRRVAQMINSSSKPYVRFGIGPAGVACPPNVTTEYGLPSVTGDWQYNTIYSDPLNWYKNGYVDFMSPQIYWPSRWTELVNWWNNAALKFNRHFYPSTSLTGINVNDLPAQTFVDEIQTVYDIVPKDKGGIVFFDYSDFVNYAEKYQGGSQMKFGEIIKSTKWTTKALQPIMPWKNVQNPQMVSNVALNGTNLTWTGTSAGRYTVYAVPNSVTDAQFYGQKEYLDGISYTNSYTIPVEKASGYRFAVAVYDRYGNEYAPLFVGATPTTINPAQLTYPTNGVKPNDLFSFRWSGNASRYLVEISDDSSFSNVIGSSEVYEPKCSISKFPTLVTGKTYYWRVTSTTPNAYPRVSSTASFVASHIAISSPGEGATGVSLSPTITWTPAETGASYLIEVSSRNDFVTINYSTTVSGTSYTVPALGTNATYYARVTASLDGASSQSEPVAFTTLVMTPANPSLKTPASDGVTLHANEAIEVNPFIGCASVAVQISASSTFPTRTSFSQTLQQGTTCTNNLETVKVSSKNLVNGTTYYVRAQGTYTDSAGKSAKTGYSEVRTFVYSSEAGVEGVTADVVEVSAVYYNLNGVRLAAPAAGQVSIKVATLSDGTVRASKVLVR